RDRGNDGGTKSVFRVACLQHVHSSCGGGAFGSNSFRKSDDEIVPVGHLHFGQSLRVHHIIVADELVEREKIGGQRIDFVVFQRMRRVVRHGAAHEVEDG